MFAAGLVDDFVRLKPYAKLVGQIVFSTAFTLFGTRLHWLDSPVLDQALTIFWLVGIANAVNLLDNLDGLAGGVAAIAAAYLVYFCHASGPVRRRPRWRRRSAGRWWRFCSSTSTRPPSSWGTADRCSSGSSWAA